MQRHLPNSIKGVEGIPFKLIIIMVVLAISLPIIYQGFDHWDAERTETDLTIEITNLITRVKLAYLSGENNTDNVEVNFKNGVVTRVERVIIGSDPNGIWNGIKYELKGRGNQTILIQDPEIPMTEGQGDHFKGLELGPGRHILHLSVQRNPQFELNRSIDLYVDVSVVG